MPVLTPPFTAWVGLVDAGAEVAAADYARAQATFAITTDGRTVANNATLQWRTALEDWGEIDTVTLWDAATGGTVLGTIRTDAPFDIAQYDIARIGVGEIHMVQTPRGLLPAGSGIGSPYGVGPSGVGPYAALPATVTLALAFGTAAHVCEAGTWAPALVCSPGTWTPLPPASPGTWAATACGCSSQQQAA